MPYDTVVDEIKDLVRQGNDAFDAKTGELSERLDQIETTLNRPGSPMVKDSKSDEHTDAFVAWLRDPRDNVKKANLSEMQAKSANSLSDASGGFIVPEVMQGPLLTRARDENTLRQLVRVIQVSSGDVTLPISNSDATQGWVGETDTRTGTTEPTLEAPKPTFGTNYAYVEASEELVMDSSFDVASWFIEEAGAALGEAEATAIVAGNGTKKPTGMLNTTLETGADGSRSAGAFKYLASGATATLGADAGDVQDLLVNMVYDLKARYRQRASWIMNSATAGTLRKLKDADGRLIWSDGLAVGEPARLLGYPVTMSEAMADIGADAHPIGFGDWTRAYVLADRGDVRVTIDDNITTPGMVKWYIRRRVGGITHDTYAARFAKCAAS